MYVGKKYLTPKQRESKILSYLIKHPLSTIREIADNYRKNHTSNFDDTSNSIEKLFNEGKIQRILDSRECYFLSPHEDQIKDHLVQIMKSEKILESRFKKIPYYEKIDYNRPLFAQVVEQGINLFHLRLKIFRIEVRRISKSRRRLHTFKKFKSNFLKMLESYSYKKTVVVGQYIGKRTKKEPVPKNPQRLDILIWLSDYMHARHAQDIIYFKLLRFNGLPLKKRIELLKIAIYNSPKEAANIKRKTLKNVHKMLEPLLIDRGKGKEFSLEKIALYKQAESGRTLVSGIKREEIGKILFQMVLKRTLWNIEKTKDHNRIEFERNYSDIDSKMFDQFDTS